MNKDHSFHFAAMGIAYTTDTILKFSQVGIDSFILLVDDVLKR
jgi:hypothetical protein